MMMIVDYNTLNKIVLLYHSAISKGGGARRKQLLNRKVSINNIEQIIEKNHHIILAPSELESIQAGIISGW